MKLISKILILALIPSLLLGQSIPDEINHVKYKKIFDDAKIISDTERAKADDLLATAQEIDRSISFKKQSVIDKTHKISENESFSAQLGQQILDLQLENSILRSEIIALASSIDSNQTELARLENLHFVEQGKLTRENAVYQNISADLTIVQDRYNTLLEEIQFKENHVATLEQNNRALEQSIGQIRRQRRQSQTEVDDLYNEERSLHRHINQLANQLDDFRKTQERIERRIQRLQPQLAQARGERQSYRIQLDEHLAKLAKVTQRLSDLQGKIEQLKQRIPSLKTQINNQQDQLSKAQERKSSLQNEVATLQSELSNLAAQLRQTTQRFNNLKQKIAPLKERKRGLMSQLKRAQAALKNLQSNPGAHPALKTAAQEFTREIKRIKREINAHKAQVQPLLTKEQQLKNQLAHLQTSLSNKKTQLKNTKAKIAQINTTKPQMETDLATAKQKVAELKPAVQQLQAQVAPLRGKIKNLKSQQAARQKTVDDLSAKKTKLSKVRKQLIARIAQMESDPRTAPRAVKLKERLATVLENLKNTNALLAAEQEKLADTKRKLASAQGSIGPLQSKLRNTNKELANNQSKVKSLSARLAPLQQEMAQLKQSRESLQREIPALTAKLAKTTTQWQQTKQKLAPMRAAIKVKKQEQDGQQNSLQQLLANPTAFPAYKKDLAQAKQEVQRLNSSVAALDSQLAPLKQKMAQVTQRRDNFAAKKSATERKLTQVQKRLAKVKSNIPVLKNNIASSKEKLANAKARREDLRRKKQTVLARKQKLAAASPGLRNALAQAKETVRGLKEKINHARANYDDSMASMQPVQADYNRASQRYTSIKNRIPELEDYLAQSQQDLANDRRELENNLNSLALLGNQINELRNKKFQEETKIAHHEQQLREQGIVVADLEGIVANLTADINNYSATIAELAGTKSSKETQLSTNAEQIVWNQNKIIELAEDNHLLASQIKNLNSEIPVLQVQSPIAWEAFKVQDSKTQKLAAETATKQAKYLAAQSLYAARELAAIEQGRGQGERLGATEADDAGAKKGLINGTKEGTTFGQNQGNLFGYKGGLETGLVAGKKAGHQHGRNLEANYAKGHVLGYAQGKLDALAFAKNNSYPKGRASKKAIILATLPTKTETKDNREKVNSFADAIATSASALISPSLEFSGIASEGSTLVEDDEDTIVAKISDLQARLARLENAYNGSLQSAGAGLQITPHAERTKADCQVGYSVFEEKCLVAFTATYKSVYKATYLESFKVTYVEKMKEASALAFAAHKNDRTEEGYTEAYAIAYAIYDQIGAEEAENIGYQEGKTEGYENNIEAFNKDEFARGEGDEQEFFKTNAILRVVKNSVAATTTEQSFYPGATVALALKLANFGGFSSQTGQIRVKVICTTQNAQVENEVIPLTSVKGETVTRLTNVAFAKISQNARAGEDITFKITPLQANGAAMAAEYVTIKAASHINAEIATLETDLTPKIKGFRSYKKHAVTVILKNTSRTALNSGFVVTLSSANPYVRLLAGTKVSAIVNNGQSTTVKLVYRFKKKSKKKVKNKQIPLTITLTHPNIPGQLATKTIIVIPK